MLRSLGVLALSLLVATFASSVLAYSQVTSSPNDASVEDTAGSSPVAFVYVSSSPSNGAFEVSAFSAASNGQLTPISGSPFSANVQSLALNKNYLFGTDGIDIYSFAIAAGGALAQVAIINAQNLNQNSCGGPMNLFLDNTGTTLYDSDYLGNICANNAYQSFTVDAATGGLNYLDSAVASPAFSSPLSFVGNNVYGYSSSCFRFSPTIFGYKRNRDQTLSQISMNPQIPAAAAGDYYCPYLAAADSANHVAIPLMLLNDAWQTVGPAQLAVYAAGSSGNLITTSTATNMPKTAFSSVNDIRVSPSGRFVAVAGSTGLQVFHFNGANPITRFTGVVGSHAIDHLFWDDANHLYAVSSSAGKLYVYTVGASVTQATGSPYAISNPQSIAVLPKL